MCFIDDDVAVALGEIALDTLNDFSQGGDITIHAVDTFDGDEDVPLS